MAIVIERQAKTVTEAAISACEELGIPRSEVDIEVLEEGSKGFSASGAGTPRSGSRSRTKT